MDEYEFEIMSIPKTELFHSNRQISILAERNALLSVKRSRGKVTKTKEQATAVVGYLESELAEFIKKKYNNFK